VCAHLLYKPAGQEGRDFSDFRLRAACAKLKNLFRHCRTKKSKSVEMDAGSLAFLEIVPCIVLHDVTGHQDGMLKQVKYEGWQRSSLSFNSNMPSYAMNPIRNDAIFRESENRKTKARWVGMFAEVMHCNGHKSRSTEWTCTTQKYLSVFYNRLFLFQLYVVRCLYRYVIDLQGVFEFRSVQSPRVVRFRFLRGGQGNLDKVLV
jgi:hypothetical protein